MSHKRLRKEENASMLKPEMLFTEFMKLTLKPRYSYIYLRFLRTPAQISTPTKSLELDKMYHPFRRHPRRRLSTRIPSLPGHPLYSPTCEATLRFSDEESRMMHYFQEHLLNTPKDNPFNGMFLIDQGNYDGPLGKKQHVFSADRYCLEPESFLTEEESRDDEIKGEES
jgi:hypothetical protein